jgi:hypothetical protein
MICLIQESLIPLLAYPGQSKPSKPGKSRIFGLQLKAEINHIWPGPDKHYSSLQPLNVHLDNLFSALQIG